VHRRGRRDRVALAFELDRLSQARAAEQDQARCVAQRRERGPVRVLLRRVVGVGQEAVAIPAAANGVVIDPEALVETRSQDRKD
jgi:hypothetical protein